MNDDNLDRFVSNVSAVKLGRSLGIDAAGRVGIVVRAPGGMANGGRNRVAPEPRPCVATPHEPSLGQRDHGQLRLRSYRASPP